MNPIIYPMIRIVKLITAGFELPSANCNAMFPLSIFFRIYAESWFNAITETKFKPYNPCASGE